MSIWSTIETKAGTAIAGEKQGVAAWVKAHKGWLVTTGVSHVLGWIGAVVARHIL